MGKAKGWLILILLVFGCFLYSHPIRGEEPEIPKAKLPVLNTSAGQSTDVESLNIICEEAGINYDYCDVPDVALISSGVGLAGEESADTGFHVTVNTDLDKFPKGTPYQTVIFAIGASLKGMGASGLTVDDEVKRVKKIIEYCQEKDIFIIGVHLGGVSTRGASGSDNEKMIDVVAPFANYLVVTNDSNKDGRFTTIAKEKGIPLTQIEYALSLVETLQKVFN